MKKDNKLIRSVIFIFILLLVNAKAELTDKIILLVGNEVITNYDVDLEIKYLNLISDGKFKSSGREENIKTAKEYLIKDKIKINEIEKFPNLVIREEQLQFQINHIARSLGFGTTENLETFLIEDGYNIEELKKKITIELKWNQLVFQFYNNSVVIDKEKIEKKLKSALLKQKTEEYLISEIFIQGTENDELNRKFAVVIDKIKNDGFENAAIKYSSSPSSPKGGGLGWIPESEISQNLLESIKKTTIGNITDPIRVPGGLVLFNVENKRHIEKKVDMENELNRLIEVEKEKQLTQFSITYFNLVKNNTIIKSFE